MGVADKPFSGVGLSAVVRQDDRPATLPRLRILCDPSKTGDFARQSKLRSADWRPLQGI